MVQTAALMRGGLTRIALAAGALLIGAAAFGAPAVAHDSRRVVVVERPATYYVRPYGPPVAVPYYAMPYYSGPAVPAPVYYAPPRPAPVYGGSVLEFVFSLGDNDRGGYRDRDDRGRHRGWDHDRGRGHDRR
jgi:hypothetical protein